MNIMLNTGDKLRTIMRNLKAKEHRGEALEPAAFHLLELVPTKPADPQDIDEHEEWEYNIGSDTIKITWDLEDITDDCIGVYLNGEPVYGAWNGTGTQCSNYDNDAEDLFLLILQHGGVLQPQAELEYAEHFLGEETLEKRRNRAEGK